MTKNEGTKTTDSVKVGAKTLHIISHIRLNLSSLATDTL
jgi:hypothetical protein